MLCEALCIEHDLLKGEKVGRIDKLDTSCVAGEAMEGKATSTPAATRLDVKLLRNAGQQNIVVTVALLSHDHFWRQASIMIWHAEPLQK